MLGGADMPMEEEPVVGAMYEDEEGLAFEVLSFDEDDGIVEVQYEDGEVSEIDIDSWYELDLQQLKSATWKDDDEEVEEAEPEKTSKRAPIPEEDDDDEDVDDFEDADDDDSY
jgi:hypothetical protein